MQNDSSILEKAGETIGFARNYIEKRIELFRLEMTERVVTILSGMLAFIFLLSILGMVVLFASFSAGFYLATALDSFGLAFLIVTFFYVLLALVLLIFRRALIYHPILRLVIELLRDEENEKL